MFGAKLSGLSSQLFSANKFQCLRTVGYAATGIGIFYQILRRKSKISVSRNNVALITGCDSGLG